MPGLTPVRLLEIERMSQLMVPPGGGIGAAIHNLQTPGKIEASARQAREWVKQALAVLRTAKGIGPNATDDDLAAMVLVRLDQKRPPHMRRYTPDGKGRLDGQQTRI